MHPDKCSICVVVVGGALITLPTAFAVYQAINGPINVIAEVGSLSLGGVVGMLVGFFAWEAREWDRKAIAAAVGVIGGGGVLALMGADKWER
jgi:hypothetical protein